MVIQLDLEKRGELSILHYTILNILMVDPSYDLKGLHVDAVITGVLDMLVDEGYLKIIKGEILVTEYAVSILGTPKSSNKDSFHIFVDKFRKLWPEGKKDNKWYWRSNTPDLTKRLSSFIKKYKYTQEEILAATVSYLDTFSEDNTLMQLSKYFIIKGDSSTLLEVLENKDVSVTNHKAKWA